MQIRTTIQCRLCKGSRLTLVFDLGVQALAGRFPAPEEPDVPSAPLQLLKCDSCHLVQLGHQVELEELYGGTYGYRSGINATMTDHLARIVRQVERMVLLRPDDTVLDIASNDGTLLKSYSDKRIFRVGIDPTIAQYESFYPDNIIRAPEFFSEACFRRISPTPHARVITSIAMFYDLPDIGAFVGDVASVLAPDGLWVLEQSDLGMMLEARSFDTICHEHLEYYGLHQIEMAVESHNLRVFDIENNSINGGSARVFVCHRDGPFPTHTEHIEQARQDAEVLRLTDLATYEAFRRSAEETRRELRVFLTAEKAKGKTIHLYGASTKGNVLLQYCGIDRSLIDVAAERNPVKYGRRTPGTNIPIVSEDESRARRPDYYLVLPWHFREEFMRREANYLASGGKLIFPLPRLEVCDSQAVSSPSLSAVGTGARMRTES
jgi:hypothetical protein